MTRTIWIDGLTFGKHNFGCIMDIPLAGDMGEKARW